MAAVRSGKHLATKEPNGADPQFFMRQHALWPQREALCTVVHQSEDARHDFDVIGCRCLDMYRKLGLEESGHLPSCNGDARLVECYASQLSFSRTQTIVQSIGHCDFRDSASSDRRAAA